MPGSSPWCEPHKTFETHLWLRFETAEGETHQLALTVAEGADVLGHHLECCFSLLVSDVI